MKRLEYKAIKDVDSGSKKSIVANKVGIPLNTLSTWLKNREKIEEAVTQNAVVGQRKRQRAGQFEDVEEALLCWFRDALKNNVPINGPLVCSKAQQFSERLQVELISKLHHRIHLTSTKTSQATLTD